MHDPEHAEEAAAARRTGGLRRRRERAIGVAYDIDGVTTIAQLQRVLEVVIMDGLGQENTVARGRLLVSAVLAAAKLIEVGDHEARILDVEEVLSARLHEVKRRR